MDNRRVELHATSSAELGEAAVGTDADAQRTAVTSTLSELLDHPEAVALTSSCTHALEAAALLMGVGAGDEVVVPAFTYPSTANAFLLRGATIRFADVDPATGNVDPDSVAARTTRRTRAVVCVHYGGVACDLEALGAQSVERGWDLVEDAAQALFGSYEGRPLGRFGRLSCFSFHRTKNVACGEGGALVVNDPDLVSPMEVVLDKGTNRAEFDSGRVDSYEWCGPGSAWRLPAPAVPILAAELTRRSAIQARRHAVWDRYRSGLAEWADAVGARLPTVPEPAAHPAHLFWLVLPPSLPRERFVAACARRGVQAARHFGSLPESRYGRLVARPEDRCPGAAELAARLVRIPLHHRMGTEDVEHVIETVTRLGV